MKETNLNEQNTAIVFDRDTLMILEKLSAESQMTPTQLLGNFIRREDSSRHIKWSRKEQKMIRVNCGLKECLERRPYDAKDLAD